MSGNLLLRTMTMKSVFTIGKYAGQTVETVLKIDLNYLRWCYYKLAKVSFTEEVLNQLSIIDEYKIPKPSINDEVYHKLNILLNESLSDNERLLKYRRRIAWQKNKDKMYHIRCEKSQGNTLQKAALQSANQGGSRYKLNTMKIYPY